MNRVGVEPWGKIFVKTNLTIYALIKIINTKLPSGLCFGGVDEYIHEEVPAAYTSQIPGHRLIISTCDGGFSLTLQSDPRYFSDYYDREFKSKIRMNVDSFLLESFRSLNINDVTFMPWPPAHSDE